MFRIVGPLTFMTTLLGVWGCSQAEFESGRLGWPPSTSKDSSRTTPESADGSASNESNCTPEVHLPDEPTSLVQTFNWQASGPHADFNQVMATPVVAPLQQGKAIPSIIVPAFRSCNYTNHGAYLYSIAGATGEQEWVSDVRVLAGAAAAIGNIDNTGDNEVVAYGLDLHVYAFDAFGRVQWRSAEPGLSLVLNHGGPIIADLDRDGTPEIVAQTKVFNGFDGSTKFALPIEDQYANIVAETDGDPELEIVAFNGIYKADGRQLCAFPKPLVMQAASRLRSDDETATVVGRVFNKGDEIQGFNGRTCKRVFFNRFPDMGGGPYNIADMDGDGVLDFGTAGAKAYVTFDANGKIRWSRPTKDTSSISTGSTTFDFNADGRFEVVYNDEDHLRIFDGNTGSIYYEMENSSGTLFEYPVIVDVDADGHANIVVAANDCFRYTNRSAHGVRVFQSPNNDWVNTRRIWNQHGYSPYLVDDNGGVVDVDASSIASPWLKSLHLAGYRNNIPMPRQTSTSCGG